MEKISLANQHSPKTLAVALLIIALSIVDSYLTIDLLSRGAEELNPIMSFYLNQGPRLFFLVKYMLTCAAIMIILIIKDNYIWRIRFRAEFLLVPFFFVMVLVISWQLFLLYTTVD